MLPNNHKYHKYTDSILYMLLPFDVGINYLLDLNKCTHLVSGGIHSTFLEILLWSATEQVTGN